MFSHAQRGYDTVVRYCNLHRARHLLNPAVNISFGPVGKGLWNTWSGGCVQAFCKHATKPVSPGINKVGLTMRLCLRQMDPQRFLAVWAQTETLGKGDNDVAAFSLAVNRLSPLWPHILPFLSTLQGRNISECQLADKAGRKSGHSKRESKTHELCLFRLKSVAAELVSCSLPWI